MGHIESGKLVCEKCGEAFPIVAGIPRFVSLDNYANSFGLEWTLHAKTQYDSYSGKPISEERFFNETGWARSLTGEIMLEAGSGSGRFTEIAAQTGAMVVSFDYSEAVEANYASNQHFENVLIVQASIYEMPFPEAYFDKVLCIGVLQHTPDVEKSFFHLPPYLKSGGQLVVDVYRKRRGLFGLLSTRYYVRPLTRRIKPSRLYRLCSIYVNSMWGIAKVIHRIPKIGRKINWALLIGDYIDLGLADNKAREWAILDTFDIVAPAYDQPQYIETVENWFQQGDFSNSNVRYGYNGIEGHGTKV